MKLAELEHKKILIIGLGEEGAATYRFLKKHLKTTTIETADEKDGPDYLNKQADFELVVKSPGVPPRLVTIPYTTAANIFFANFQGFTIGVTGTKGKSTTTKLIYDILKSTGKSVALAGNIGIPLLQVLEEFNDPHGIAVCELSSYQLEGFKYAPNIALITNIYDAHLPHHGGRQNYIAAKTNLIAAATSSSHFIYNPDSAEVKRLLTRTKAQPVPFQARALAQPPQLPGDFNGANIRAAQTVAAILKIPEPAIIKAINNFEPLPHRLQLIGTYKAVKFYDDATSTTPESTIAALKTLQPVQTLLLGGQDIGYDFSELVQQLLESQVRNLVLFPDSGPKIRKLLVTGGRDADINILETTSMKEAIEFAYKHTPPGEICLLSTATPAFTVWKDFREKAAEFHKFVKALAQS